MKRGKAAYIPPEVLEAVLAEQQGHLALRNRAILLTSHLAGLRSKELASLKVGDIIDPRTGEVREVTTLTRTKGDKPREIQLVNADLRSALIDYARARPRRPSAPFFLSQKGGAFTADTMRKLLKNIYAAAGLNRASSHSGRRSFATRLNQQGADIFSIMVLMGHSSITTTQEYIATDPLRLRRFAAAI